MLSTHTIVPVKFSWFAEDFRLLCIFTKWTFEEKQLGSIVARSMWSHCLGLVSNRSEFWLGKRFSVAISNPCFLLSTLVYNSMVDLQKFRCISNIWKLVLAWVRLEFICDAINWHEDIWNIIIIRSNMQLLLYQLLREE